MRENAPMQRHIVVDCPSRMLTFFDPLALAHRQTADRKWMKDRAAVQQEVAAGKVGTLPLEDERISFFVREGEATASAGPTGTLEVKSGGIYFGDVSHLVSKAWGHRRWNFWDWVFALFLVSLIPFGFWLAGFDKQLLLTLAILGVLTVIASAAIAFIFFRGGGDFEGRTGSPARDHPDRVVAIPPGTYTWSTVTEADELTIVLARR